MLTFVGSKGSKANIWQSCCMLTNNHANETGLKWVHLIELSLIESEILLKAQICE